MTKRNIGDEIVESMQEAVKYMRGKKTKAITHKIKIPENIDVRSIREKLKLSRPVFADRFGFSSRTIQHWEQGSRRPQGAARVLLLLLQREPDTIEKILNYKNSKVIKSNVVHKTSFKCIQQAHTVRHKRKSI